MILKEFGFEVPIIIRTPQELQNVIKKNPFSKIKAFDPARVYFVFLSEAPKKAALKNLEALPSTKDLYRLIGSELYLYCMDGFGKSKLASANFEKILSVRTTARNWNTVNKLLEMGLK